MALQLQVSCYANQPNPIETYILRYSKFIYFNKFQIWIFRFAILFTGAKRTVIDSSIEIIENSKNY